MKKFLSAVLAGAMVATMASFSAFAAPGDKAKITITLTGAASETGTIPAGDIVLKVTKPALTIKSVNELTEKAVPAAWTVAEIAAAFSGAKVSGWDVTTTATEVVLEQKNASTLAAADFDGDTTITGVTTTTAAAVLTTAGENPDGTGSVQSDKVAKTTPVSGDALTFDAQDHKVEIKLANTYFVKDGLNAGPQVSAADLIDKDYFSFKVKKNDGSKIIKSIKLEEKSGSRNLLVVKFNEDMTDKEFKIDLDVTFTAKAKAEKELGVAVGATAKDNVKFWIKNFKIESEDVALDAGMKGKVAKPIKNEDNEVIWSDENRDLAKLNFEADSDVNAYYPKLSTKWDNSVYAEKFADQDAFIFSFVGNPTISSTSRPVLTIFNPYVNDDDELTVDLDDIVVYEVVDGELVDVTAKFDIGEDEDGDYVLVARTRTLGTYIIAEAPAAVADEAVEAPEEDGKAVPDTGR